MSFDLDGYIDVAARLQILKDMYPEASLQPMNAEKPYAIERIGDKTYIVVVAACYRDPMDARPGVGMAWQEIPGKGFTAGSELMVAETSAWGRAIVAAIQTATKRIASKQEVKAAQMTTDEGLDANGTTAWQRAHMAQAKREPIPVANAIDELPDKVATGELEAPPRCKHGTMLQRKGTSEKTGLPYFGYVCSEKARDRQCQPNWYELSPTGQWREKIAK